ncbi:MAG: hypothetical protein U9Q68_08485 [Euryarchaeota archaeon]|nr:hypothetical protein [Euryarchaeota archaeon]
MARTGLVDMSISDHKVIIASNGYGHQRRYACGAGHKLLIAREHHIGKRHKTCDTYSLKCSSNSKAKSSPC